MVRLTSSDQIVWVEENRQWYLQLRGTIKVQVQEAKSGRSEEDAIVITDPDRRKAFQAMQAIANFRHDPVCYRFENTGVIHLHPNDW